MLVLVISTLLTVTREKTVETIETTLTAETTRAIIAGKNEKGGKYLGTNLAQVLYIYYLIFFQRKSVLAFFDSDNKVNAIYPAFAKEPILSIRLINVGVQKINSIILDIYGIVVVAFLVTDKANQQRFLKKNLVANISLKVILEKLFLILSEANIDFLNRKLRLKSYSI